MSTEGMKQTTSFLINRILRQPAAQLGAVNAQRARRTRDIVILAKKNVADYLRGQPRKVKRGQCRTSVLVTGRPRAISKVLSREELRVSGFGASNFNFRYELSDISRPPSEQRRFYQG